MDRKAPQLVSLQQSSQCRLLALPYELKVKICDTLPVGDYPQLARCCKQLQDEILPIIYARSQLRIFGVRGPTHRCDYKRALASLNRLPMDARLKIKQVEFHFREPTTENLAIDLRNVLDFLLNNMRPHSFIVYYHCWADSYLKDFQGFNAVLQMLKSNQAIIAIEEGVKGNGTANEQDSTKHHKITNHKLVVPPYRKRLMDWSRDNVRHVVDTLAALESKPITNLEICLPTSKCRMFEPQWNPAPPSHQSMSFHFLGAFDLHRLCKLVGLQKVDVTQYNDEIGLTKKGEKPVSPAPVPGIQAFIDKFMGNSLMFDWKL